MTKMFVVLEKCLETEQVTEIAIFDDFTEADSHVEKLINGSEPDTFAYKIEERREY